MCSFSLPKMSLFQKYSHNISILRKWTPVSLKCECILNVLSVCMSEAHERDVLSQVGSECPGLLWQPRVGPGFGLLDKHRFPLLCQLHTEPCRGLTHTKECLDGSVTQPHTRLVCLFDSTTVIWHLNWVREVLVAPRGRTVDKETATGEEMLERQLKDPGLGGSQSESLKLSRKSNVRDVVPVTSV